VGLFGRRDAASSALEQHSHDQARPWLVGASLAMMLAALLLAWTATWALTTVPVLSLSDPQVAMTVKEFDIAISSLVALAVTLLGRAIVAYEVFTGRPLPRDRFFSQWRSTVIVAGGFGAVVSLILVIGLRPIYSLMLATAMMTLFYALSSWRSFADREAFMARLRPFLASQNLYERLTRPSEPPSENKQAQQLFATLCADLLNTQAGALVPLGRLESFAGPPLFYPPDDDAALPDMGGWNRRFSPEVRCLPTGTERLAWAVPLWTRDVLAGVLFLGQKRGGGPYSEEEIELVQAGGERLLDLLAGSELARLSLDLLRQRLVEARVLEGRGRRVLHDEVLPELHTAVLYLSAAGSGADPSRQDAVAMLTAAHRRISDLLRASSPDLPASLARDGLAAALRGLIAADFSVEFDRLDWQIQADAEEQGKTLQPLAAEAVYFAARELVRNAARYGRGAAAGSPLALTIRMECLAGRLRLVIQDDGVGLGSRTGADGAGSGLRIHSAMLAAVGGSLEVSAVEPHGACAVMIV
jgi:signal transduction histidine kinase